MPAATEAVTQALPTQGSKLEIAPDSAGAAGTYAEVGQFEDITPPDDTEVMLEFRTNSSPKGYLERLPANQAALGLLTFTLIANPDIAVQDTLNGYKDARTLIWVRWTDASTKLIMVMTGYVNKKVSVVGDGSAPLKLQVEFSPTGQIRTGSTYVNP